MHKSDLVLPDGKFDLASWRILLEDVVNSTNPSNQVICPFGFEVSRNPEYLKKNLHNFYIYLGVNSLDHEDQQNALDMFIHQFLEICSQRYPQFFAQIYQISPSSCTFSNNLLGKMTLYFRCQYCSGDLLKQYSVYLLCVAGGVVHNQIKAYTEFHRDPISRRYLFQLCIILGHIFGNLLSLSQSEIDILSQLVRQLHKSELAELPRNFCSPAAEEDITLQTTVLPYVHKLYRAISKPQYPEDIVLDLQVKDFHGVNILTSKISQSVYQDKLRYIIESYLGFI